MERSDEQSIFAHSFVKYLGLIVFAIESALLTQLLINGLSNIKILFAMFAVLLLGLVGFAIAVLMLNRSSEAVLEDTAEDKENREALLKEHEGVRSILANTPDFGSSLIKPSTVGVSGQTRVVKKNGPDSLRESA